MSNRPRIITLTTDFGDGSPYVAQLKGVMLGLDRKVAIVDVTHGIRPQNIRHAAIVLDDHTRCFPPGTVHVTVVDPGVGSQRDIIAIHHQDHMYVGPDNGVFSHVVRDRGGYEVVALRSSRYWRQPVSPTFHGRDIMAPVAVQLANGLSLDELGTHRSQIVTLPWNRTEVRDGSIQGEVWSTDSFGNVITNITRSDLKIVPRESKVSISCGGHTTDKLAQFYGQFRAGTLVGLIGSNDRLELALVNGNAAEYLKVHDGQTVAIAW